MPSQDRQRQAPPRERAREGSGSASGSQSRTPGQLAFEEAASAGKRKNDMAVGEARVTAGKDGAQNIRVEWVPVPLPAAVPCRFVVTTAAGNGLEVNLEQMSYRKTYQGTSAVNTDIMPVAPVGTPGKLTARDLTTGELLEQPWKWRPLGKSFWTLIKELFT